MARKEDLVDKYFPEDDGNNARGMRTLSLFAVAIAMIFISAVVYFYLAGHKTVDPNNLPTIAESKPPERIRPADPGGMDIPHQDSSVYEHLDTRQSQNGPEKLLPAPEAPLAFEQVNAITPPTAPVTLPDALPGLPSAQPTPPGPQQALPTQDQTSNAPSTPNAPANSSAQTETTDTVPLNFRIQLGAVKDETAANTEWARMEKKYGEILKGTTSYFSPVNLGEQGAFLRIQTQPLTHADAEARCQKLKLVNQACLIVKVAQ